MQKRKLKKRKRIYHKPELPQSVYDNIKKDPKFRQTVRDLLNFFLDEFCDMYTGVCSWKNGKPLWAYLASGGRGKNSGFRGVPSTPEEVRDYLKTCSLKREDIRQEILMFLWRYKKKQPRIYFNIKTYVPFKFMFSGRLRSIVHRYMANWLFRNNIFKDNLPLTYWKYKYKIWLTENDTEEEDSGVLSIFHESKKRTLYERYFLYLWYIEKLNRPEMAHILQTNVRQIERFKQKLQRYKGDSNASPYSE